jgi:predicted CoA-binding protein
LAAVGVVAEIPEAVEVVEVFLLGCFLLTLEPLTQ